MVKYNEENWTNVLPSTEYGLGTVWQRFGLLAKEDPFLAFFSEHTINAIANLVCSDKGIGEPVEDSLGHYAEKTRVENPKALQSTVLSLLDESPIGYLATDALKRQIVSLFMRSTFPKWVDVRNSMRTHMDKAHDVQVYIGDEFEMHLEKFPDCDWKV